MAAADKLNQAPLLKRRDFCTARRDPEVFLI